MLTGKYLWVIDNDPIYQFTLRKTLEIMSCGVQISMFDNGRGAINFLQKQLSEHGKIPDIIFLDINMPVLDGWGFIREFDAMAGDFPQNIELYLLTSSIDDEDRKRALSYSSVSGYRIKPLSHSELEKLLKELAVPQV